MLYLEFYIDTGNSPPVCCIQPVYGFHEIKIMTKLINNLEESDLIFDCEGASESLLLLTAKPHQESCQDIHAFVWILCVSYCALNIITIGFEFPISRCADSIEDLGDSCGSLYNISLDARNGYHQLSVRKNNQEKIAFFTSNRTNKTYKVMPFGPKMILYFILP